jgi:hypothetical protein
MGNQQGNELDLAWLAGFIDGEGSIMFRVQRGARLKGMGLTYYYPAIRICNTGEPTLRVVTDILDANGLPYHVSHRNEPVKENWHKAWDVEVKGLKRCAHWLSVIIPYLRTKQYKAILMLEFIRSREGYAIGEGYSLREQEILDQLRIKPIRPHRLHASTE